MKEPTMKGLLELLLIILFALTVSVTPLHAESQRIIVNLRGEEVVVPGDVPPKERFVLQQLISVENRFIVFLYSGPKFQHRVDYAETYNLNGELLEIAWYDPAGGLKRARDINVGNPKASRPARILEMFREFRQDGRRSKTAKEVGTLEAY
jgi:hypothetical protein